MKKEEQIKFKKDVKDFFNRLAPDWEKGLVRNEEVIETILNNAGISKGDTVLDVACGTGVLFPYYLKKEVKKVVGIDLSEKMIEEARKLHRDETVELLVGDVESQEFEKKFDRIMVYNAFPHFADPDSLIKKLSSVLKEGGTLSIAHGMSRKKINIHHENVKEISLGLMEAEDLKKIFARYLKVETVISNNEMYQVTGRKI